MELLLADSLEGVVSGGDLHTRQGMAEARDWSLDALAGRFTELRGGADAAGLSALTGLMYAVQRQGDYAAWVSGRGSLFFPPDFAAAGIDVTALPIVQVDSMRQAARAADMLLRSGAFMLVMLDLDTDKDFTLPMQTRLKGLAKANHTALIRLFPASRDNPRSSLVSLRVETEQHRIGHNAFVGTFRAMKDKQRSPGWEHTELYCGTDGLC